MSMKSKHVRKHAYTQESWAILIFDCAMRPVDGPWKFSGVPDWLVTMPTATFQEIYLVYSFIVPIDPMNVRTKFEVHSFTRSWENNNSNLSSIFTRFRDIIPVRFCAPAHHFPHPNSLLKFPHVPRGVGGYSFSCEVPKSECVGLIVRAITVVSKISNLCDTDPPTLQVDRQTDRQMDGRHSITRLRLHYRALVHRTVKMYANAVTVKTIWSRGMPT